MVRISTLLCRPRLVALPGLLGLLLAAWGGPMEASAQTPTTTIQNGSGAPRLELNYDGSLLVPGTFGPTTPADSIPATGAGTRLMWYPAKAAFRVGRVGENKDGTQWDAAKVGTYSTAFGVDTKASGSAATAMSFSTTASAFGATAMGEETTASGLDATAMGFQTTASGAIATAMGRDATASGDRATAMGNFTTASGNAATAMGDFTTASGKAATATGDFTTASGEAATAMGSATNAASSNSLSVGANNSANTSPDGTLLVAGNGSSESDRADALVLKRDGDLAVGPSDPQDLRLHVTKDRPNVGVSDNPSGNMVLFENTDDGTRPDVLGLQAGPTDPGSGVTYVSFYQRDGTTVGGIEGGGNGGVNYTSEGADFAEELPVADGAETPEPADLVGVRGGAASLNTDDADRVMVASTAPIMTGNTASSAQAESPRVKVAFVGQVPVKVRGAVAVGDLIVASDENDGTGQAVAPEEYRRAEHGPFAGQAWSARSGDGLGTVTVAVGLGRSGAVAERLKEQQQTNQKQQAQIEDLNARLAALEADRSPSAAAGWTGSSAGLLLSLLLGGLLGAGLLWRRRA